MNRDPVNRAIRWRRIGRGGVVALASVALLTGLMAVRALVPAGGTTASAGGLSVFVGYAEDKEIQTPNPAQFPVPWAGAPNTIFLGGTVPGQSQCGTLTTCYDAGAIRLDNPGPSPITVSNVSVDDHSSLPGGAVFDNLWGSFTVPAGESVILTENPPADNPSFDNFDTSGFPVTCTPITVAPTVTITVNGVATTLVDSTHVLDSGGTDAGSCPPDRNESIQWRPIGSAGSDAATLTLGPSVVTATAGTATTQTATLLDGGGQGLPDATVDFAVTSGPDAGDAGSAVTNGSGQATFTFTGSPGEDEVVASITTVGTFSSSPSRVMWTDGSSTGWTGSDIGRPFPPGGQSFDPTSGAWTMSGDGTGVGGTSDEFHFVRKTLPGVGGVAARVASLTGRSTAAQAGVMVRSSTAPGSPFYAALVTPGEGVEVEDRSTAGGGAQSVVATGGSVPTYLWVADTGATVTTYTSSDGTTWTPLPGSAATLGLGASVLAGLAVSSTTPGSLATAIMNSVAVSADPPAPLPAEPCPSPFTCADIGSPALAGTQSYDPNSSTWTVTAAGTDITGTSDQFRFVSEPVTGDGSVSTQVTSQTDSSSNAKAGVMLRASSDPGSPEYSVVVSPGAGIKVQERSTEDGTTNKLANPAGTVPAYLEVTRSGSTFTASTSPDGVNWTVIPGSSFTMSLPAALLGGLAVTSHNAGQLGTATMDAVTPRPSGRRPPPPRARRPRCLQSPARPRSPVPTSAARHWPAPSPTIRTPVPGPSPPPAPTSPAPPTSSVSSRNR